MATITERRTTPVSLSESTRKVHDPLRRLRGYIRSYVITEAVTVLIICLALLFWVGLAFDYFLFKFGGIDLVKDLPRWMRAVLLAAGLLAVGFIVEIGKSLRLRPEHNPNADAPVGTWLSRNPWSLVVAFGLFVALFFTGWIVLALLRDSGTVDSLIVGLIFGGIVLAFLTIIVLKRYLHEFSDQSLALVLEKRFPKILGDRLITAVELNDPAIAARYGYSSVMVEQTIHEAAQRVDKLHLREVFDWKRLYVQAGLALALTAGVFVLTLAGMYAVEAFRDYQPSERVLVQVDDKWVPGSVLAVVTETIPANDEEEEREERHVVVSRGASADGILPVKVPLSDVKKDISVGGLLNQLQDSSAIWAERNVLLDNERWPTRSLLILTAIADKPVPASGEFKIGKGTDGKDAQVDLKGMAVEYARRDPSVPQCWRAGTLVDLRKLGIGSVIAEDALPKTWKPRDAEAGWTVDELKLKLLRQNRGEDPAPSLVRSALLTMLAEVDEMAGRTSMSRTLRKLVVPHRVDVECKTEDGRKHFNEPMTAGDGNNEYTATLDSLSQSIDFNLAAEDYRGDSYRITLVPPPRVAKLTRHEAHPAYLYHLAERRDARLELDPMQGQVAASTAALLTANGGAGALVASSALYPERPYDDDKFFLGHRKQKRKPLPVDVLGSIKPRIDPPIGSDMTLVAVTDKDLIATSIRLVDASSPLLARVVPKAVDEIEPGVTRTFELTIPNVRTTLEFRLTFVDTDGAPGSQLISIEPKPDESPDIRQFKPEVLRQVNNKFLMTPTAIIPFSYDIKDNEGLSSVEYVYSISEAPSAGEATRRAARAAAGVGLALSGPEAPLTSYTYLRALPVTLVDRRDRLEGRLPLAHFQQLFNSQRQGLRWETTRGVLDTPMDLNRRMVQAYFAKDLKDLDAYLEDHEKDIGDVPFLKGMDVGLIRRNDGGVWVPLKARDWEIQRQYEMEVRLEVKDTNLDRAERGKKSAPAGVPIQFTIVSEVELLYEVGQEEQRLYDELFKSYSDLRKAQEQLQGIRFDLPPQPQTGKPVQFDAFSVRVEEVEKALNEGKRVLTKVQLDYERVLRELRTNRIQNRDYLKKVKDEIVIPLKQIKDGDYQIVDAGEKERCGYPHTQSAANNLRKTIDNTTFPEARRLDDSRYYAEKTDKEVERLVQALGNVLAQMRGLIGLNEILKQIVQIEQRERELMQKVENKRKELEEDLFKGLLDPKK